MAQSGNRRTEQQKAGRQLEVDKKRTQKKYHRDAEVSKIIKKKIGDRKKRSMQEKDTERLRKEAYKRNHN